MTQALAKVPVERTHARQTKLAIFPGQKPGDPDVTAIVKLGPDGLIRSMMTRVTLDPRKGETFGLPALVDGEWKTVQSITAAGYDRLNLFAGVSFVSPETVKGDDGADRPNPCIERGPNGEVLCVRVRRIGIGRVPSGNLVARDLTVQFDLRTYLAQDLWSKWTGKKKDPAPKSWGFVLPLGAPLPADKKGGNWAAYVMPAGVTLYIDLSSKEVLAIIGEHINRQKFAERNAVTICDRNILKKFFAAAKLAPDLTVPVVGWVQADRDLMDLGRVAAEANKGRVQIDGGEQLDVTREQEVVDDPEEVDAALAGEADEDQVAGDEAEEGDAEPASVAPSAASHAQDDPCRDIRGEVRMLIQEIGEEAARPTVAHWEVETKLTILSCKDPDKLAALHEALQRRQLEIASEKGKARTGTGKPAVATKAPPGKQAPLIPGAAEPAARY